jgi:hypothetical protein
VNNRPIGENSTNLVTLPRVPRHYFVCKRRELFIIAERKILDQRFHDKLDQSGKPADRVTRLG